MKKAFTMISVILFLLTGCSSDINYDYQPPININDGLEVGTLDEVNINEILIEKGLDKLLRGKYNEVHSILIFKDNKLVLEEYFDGHKYKWDNPGYHGELVNWDQQTAHEMMSVTKSFTSALVGIAIDEGFIERVDQSIFDYLPNHQHLKVDNREYITIEHLVTMTAGLAWDEWSAPHGTSANDIDSLWFDCEETITCVLERPWWEEPGKLFTYNGGGMAILGEIIKNSSGMNIEEFSNKYLFEPMGIENTKWSQFPGGVWDGSGAVNVTPRSMIKFGAIYLNNGKWNDQQIIPSEWVEKSSTIYNNNYGINIPGEDSGINGYGYTWWISEFAHKDKKIKMFRAGGWGGQEIMVFPELDMLVVFTGANYEKTSKLFDFIEKYIIPAID